MGDPPDNGAYLVAAYVVTAAILIGYWLRLWRLSRSSLSGSEKRKLP
jgi:hypothetical protein